LTMWINRLYRRLFAVFLVVAGCGRDHTSELISQLNDPQVPVRRSAVRALYGQSNVDERVIAALVKSANDSDSEVRALSIGALVKLNSDSRSNMPLLKSALADPEQRVRVEAAQALLRIDPQDNASRSVFIAAMRAADGRTLLAVGAMGAEASWAVPTLMGLLSHATPQTRALAARTLGRIGPPALAAKTALEAVSRDSNPAVQNAAKDALYRLQAKANGVEKTQ
jgi:HEAT repeat protein